MLKQNYFASFWGIILLFCYFIYSSLAFSFYVNQKTDKDPRAMSKTGKNHFLPFERFENFNDFTNKSHALSFSIINMEISPPLFLSQISELKNLKTFELRNVFWKNRFNAHIYLEKLEDVSISRKNVRLSDLTEDEFSDMLFFRTEKNSSKLPGSLSLRGELGGDFIFYFSTVHCKNIPFDVMKYLEGKKIKNVVMENSTVDFSKVKAEVINELELNNVKILNGDIQSFLKNLTSVRKLYLKDIFESNSHQLKIDFGEMSIGSLNDLEIKSANVLSTKLVTFESLHRRLTISFTDSNVNFENISISHTVELKIINSKVKGLQKLITESILAVLSLKNNLKNQDFLLFDFDWLKNSENSLLSIELEGVIIDTINSESLNFSKIAFASFLSTQFTNPNMLKSLLRNAFQELPTIEIDNILTYELLEDLMSMEKLDTIFFTGINFISDEKLLEFIRKNLSVSLSYYTSLYLRKVEGIWIVDNNVKDDTVDKNANIVFYAYFIGFLIISSLGLIGNFISILVLASRKLRKSSSSIILISLAFFDSIILISFILSLQLYAFKLVTLFLELYKIPRGKYDRGTKINLLGDNPIDKIKEIDDFYSYFIYPLSKTAYTGSVYSTVLITLERFVSVTYPLLIKKWTSFKKSFILIALVILFSILTNFPRWLEAYGSKIEVRDERNEVYKLFIERRLSRVYYEKNILQESVYRLYYHGVLWTFLMYILPIGAIMAFNLIIWKKVKESKSRRKSMTTESQNENDEKEMRGLTLMLITISLIFTICNILSGVLVVIFVSYGSYDPKDIEVISSIPIVINSSINFIIYFLMGKRFREELFTIFKCKSQSQLNVNTRSYTPRTIS